LAKPAQQLRAKEVSQQQEGGEKKTKNPVHGNFVDEKFFRAALKGILGGGSFSAKS